jgi:hypothetical protein
MLRFRYKELLQFVSGKRFFRCMKCVIFVIGANLNTQAANAETSLYTAYDSLRNKWGGGSFIIQCGGASFKIEKNIWGNFEIYTEKLGKWIVRDDASFIDSRIVFRDSKPRRLEFGNLTHSVAVWRGKEDFASMVQQSFGAEIIRLNDNRISRTYSPIAEIGGIEFQTNVIDYGYIDFLQGYRVSGFRFENGGTSGKIRFKVIEGSTFIPDNPNRITTDDYTLETHFANCVLD